MESDPSQHWLMRLTQEDLKSISAAKSGSKSDLIVRILKADPGLNIVKVPLLQKVCTLMGEKKSGNKTEIL